MARGVKGKQSRRMKKLSGVSQKSSNAIVFDITPEKIDELPAIIKQAILTKSAIVPMCSMADNLPGTELCQIPEVKELFMKACNEYGLLGYMQYQSSFFPRTEELVRNIIAIVCGKLTKTNGVEFEMEIDIEEFRDLCTKSVVKFNELYV